MERKSNTSVWQLGLFEGFDRDVMVMQRDDEEVFDDAVHVFFEREYYDAYVAKAVKYGSHSYAYHEDKLGEVVNQIFAEDIQGLVLHININVNVDANEASAALRSQLCDEKYISAKDLTACREAADSYHLLYTTSIDRCAREEAIAALWTRYVYIIGQLPDMRKKPAPGEKRVYELMTVRRKNDGSAATAEDFDYEALQVFLTADSAMRHNPDKKPVGKYKLSMLSQLVRGKLRVMLEPHRSYRLEFDPAGLDISRYLDIPRYNDELVKQRIKEYAGMEQVYILLNPLQSDYGLSIGSPFLMKRDEKRIMMYLFEKYDDAVSYVLQNPNLLPVFDATYPVGVLGGAEALYKLETVAALAQDLGVTFICLDADTKHAIAAEIKYFRSAAGYGRDVEELLPKEDLKKVVREENGEKKHRLPIVPFYDRHNEYFISEERRAELASYIGQDADAGLAYTAELTIPELMVVMSEAAKRFDKARNENDEDGKSTYSRIMARLTVPLTERLCEKPYIYALKNKDGDFTFKNNIAYLLVTNRFESGRRGEGRLMPAGVDNPQFMERLYQKSKAAALADGPNTVCLMDTRLMLEAAKQWKKTEALRAELLIYMTQGCGLAYDEALYYYRRLKSDNDVFVEFASSVRNGEFPPMGMIEIKGETAKTLAGKQGLDMLAAYDALLRLKE